MTSVVDTKQTDSRSKSLSEAFVNSFGGYPIGYGIGVIVLPISMGWLQEDVFTKYFHHSCLCYSIISTNLLSEKTV